MWVRGRLARSFKSDYNLRFSGPSWVVSMASAWQHLSAYLNGTDDWSGRAGAWPSLGCLTPSVSREEWSPIRFEGHIMVVIRLARGGSKKRPFYNIVVAEQKNRRDGRFLERVGFYNPLASGNAETLRLALDRVDAWVKNGAQPSDAVNRLVVIAQKAAAPAA